MHMLCTASSSCGCVIVMSCEFLNQAAFGNILRPIDYIAGPLLSTAARRRRGHSKSICLNISAGPQAQASIPANGPKGTVQELMQVSKLTAVSRI